MADTDKKENIKRFLMAAVFLGYLIFNGILLAGHELWRDEANVWLMAKELSPLQLLAEIKYQGHPCLWYLLVMPFAKIGLPFRTLSFISYSIMAVTAGLFLFKAPLYRPVKAAALFSPIFTYYYAEIARNYCLIALLLILLAVYYSKRNEKCVLYGLLLGLLVQSDMIILMAAGMISLMWLCENLWQCFRRKTLAPFWNVLKGIWIPLVSLILLIAQFYRVSDSPVFEMKRYGRSELISEVKNYSFWILERLSGRGHSFCLIFLLLAVCLLLAVSIKMKNAWAAAVMTAAYLFEAVFSVVVYQLHIWHFIALCFVLLWTIWVLYLQKEERRMRGRLEEAALCGLQILLLVLSICMFGRWNSADEASSLDNALHGVYSDGVYTAEYIKENIAPQELIVSVNVPYASTVAAYLPEYVFYFAGNGKIQSYADWSKEQGQYISLDQLLSWVRTHFPDKNEFYLLDSDVSYLTDAERLSEYEILYETKQETARGEEYTIYHMILK